MQMHARTRSLLFSGAPALLVLSAALGAHGSDPQEPDPAALWTEPPLRARVTIGEEVVQCALGGSTTLANGERLSIGLLPERSFVVPGAFSFDYPREWKFFGTPGSPAQVDGWWNINGEGAAVYIRRHAGDAEAILQEYLSNMEATQAVVREEDTLELDGRTLRGGAVTYTSYGIGVGHSNTRWKQRVFAWQESDGVAWLLTLHRQLDVADTSLLGYRIESLAVQFDLTEIVVEPADESEEVPGISEPSEDPPAIAAAPAVVPLGLDSLIASFRWWKQ